MGPSHPRVRRSLKEKGTTPSGGPRLRRDLKILTPGAVGVTTGFQRGPSGNAGHGARPHPEYPRVLVYAAELIERLPHRIANRNPNEGAQRNNSDTDDEEPGPPLVHLPDLDFPDFFNRKGYVH